MCSLAHDAGLSGNTSSIQSRPDEPAAANYTTDQTKTELSLAEVWKTILIFAGHSRLVQL
jgi:hypothetical protein